MNNNYYYTALIVFIIPLIAHMSSFFVGDLPQKRPSSMDDHMSPYDRLHDFEI